MTRDDVIATLRTYEATLRARGVRHAALFGSLARGSAGSDSDVDILIDIDPAAVQDIYSYVGLKNYIAGLFDAPVDVVNREALKPTVQPPVESDAVYAF